MLNASAYRPLRFHATLRRHDHRRSLQFTSVFHNGRTAVCVCPYTLCNNAMHAARMLWYDPIQLTGERVWNRDASLFSVYNKRKLNALPREVSWWVNIPIKIDSWNKLKPRNWPNIVRWIEYMTEEKTKEQPLCALLCFPRCYVTLRLYISGVIAWYACGVYETKQLRYIKEVSR